MIINLRFSRLRFIISFRQRVNNKYTIIDSLSIVNVISFSAIVYYQFRIVVARATVIVIIVD